MNIDLAKKWRRMPDEAKASTAYFVCSVLQKGLSLISLPIFARILTKVEYGQSTIYESWLSLLAIFITLNLGYGSFNTAMVKYEDRRGAYLASVNSVVVALSLGFLVVYLPFRDAFNTLFELPTWVMLVMTAQIVSSSALQCWYARERFENHYRKVVLITLLTSFLSVAVSLLFVFASNEKGYARILGNALPPIIVGSYLILYFCLRERTFFNSELWLYALRFNLPLVPYYISQMLFNQSDRIMISHIVGTDAAATYGVAYSLAMLLTFVLNAINGSYVPWLYKKIKLGAVKQNRRVATGIALLMALLLLCVIAAAPEIILVVASSKYLEAKWVVAPVAMSLIFHFYSQLFVNFQFYYEERVLLVIGAAVAGVANVLLNLALIPVFGYLAAGYTTLLSFFLMALMNWAMYRVVLRRRGLPDVMFDYAPMIAIAAVLMCLGFLAMALYDYPVIRYALVIVVFSIGIAMRGRVVDLWKSFRGGSAVSRNRN